MRQTKPGWAGDRERSAHRGRGAQARQRHTPHERRADVQVVSVPAMAATECTEHKKHNKRKRCGLQRTEGGPRVGAPSAKGRAGSGAGAGALLCTGAKHAVREHHGIRLAPAARARSRGRAAASSGNTRQDGGSHTWRSALPETESWRRLAGIEYDSQRGHGLTAPPCTADRLVRGPRRGGGEAGDAPDNLVSGGGRAVEQVGCTREAARGEC